MNHETRSRVLALITLAIMVTAVVFGLNAFHPVEIYQVEAAPSSQSPLSSAQEIPPAEATAEAPSSGPQEVLVEKSVDLNTATLEELDQLPGVGPAIAQRIVDHREQNGGFYDIEELMEVSGIGEKTFQKLEPYITVE